MKCQTDSKKLQCKFHLVFKYQIVRFWSFTFLSDLNSPSFSLIAIRELLGYERVWRIFNIEQTQKKLTHYIWVYDVQLSLFHLIWDLAHTRYTKNIPLKCDSIHLSGYALLKVGAFFHSYKLQYCWHSTSINGSTVKPCNSGTKLDNEEGQWIIDFWATTQFNLTSRFNTKS